MGLVKTSSLVSDIRGIIGEVQFQRTASGRLSATQSPPRRHNVNSSKQALIRSEVATISRLWKSFLTKAQRTRWEQYAATIDRHTEHISGMIRTTHGVMTGHNAFVKNNLTRYSAEIAALPTIIATAPIEIPAPNSPRAFNAIWFAATKVVRVTLTAGLLAGSRFRIWMRSKSAHIGAQVVKTVTTATTTTDILQLNGPLGFPLLFGKFNGRVDVQVDAVDANGQPSEPSKIIRGIAVTF